MNRLLYLLLLLPLLGCALTQPTTPAPSSRLFEPSSAAEHAWLARRTAASLMAPVPTSASVDAPPLELTDAMAESFIANYDLFIAFYSPWSTEWREARREFHELAKSVRRTGSTTIFATVNCAKQHGLRNRFIGLQTYPRFVYFHTGKAISYYGVLRAAQMETFLHRARGLFTRELHNVSDVVAFLAREEVSVVAVLPTPALWSLFPSRAEALLKAYRQMMDEGLYLDLSSAYVRNSTVMQHFGLRDNGALVLQDRFGCYLRPFNLSKADISAWATHADSRLLFHTNRDLGALAADRPSLLWCFTARYSDTDTLLALAAKYEGRVRFLLIDRLRYPTLMTNLGFPSSDAPVAALLYPQEGLHATFTPSAQPLVASELDNFLERSLKGQVAPHARVEPSATVTLATLEREMQAPSPRTKLAVLYYQPWHGASKVAEVLWDDVISRDSTPKICATSMIKFNLRLSDAPDLLSFPQVSLSPARNRTAVTWFAGPWTRTALRSFLCSGEL